MKVTIDQLRIMQISKPHLIVVLLLGVVQTSPNVLKFKSVAIAHVNIYRWNKSKNLKY